MTFCRRCHAQISIQEDQCGHGLCGACLHAIAQQEGYEQPNPSPGAPQPNYMNRQVGKHKRNLVAFRFFIFVFSLVFIMSLSLFTVIGVLKKPAHQVSSPVASIAPPSNRPVVNTSVEDIISQYQANQAASLDWLKQNSVSLSSQIDKITASDSGPETDISFWSHERPINSAPTLIFEFGPNLRAQIDALHEGEPVTVVGYFEQKTWRGDLLFNGTSIKRSN